MRRLSLRALAVCLFTASIAPGFTGKAEACISSPGDLRIISRAIGAKSTPKADKVQLRRLRAVMVANRGEDSRQVARYQAASLQALKMIGEDTVIPHDAAKAAATARKPGTPLLVGC